MAHHAAECFAEEMRLNGNSFEFLEIADGTNGVDATPIFSKTFLVGFPCARKLQHAVGIHLLTFGFQTAPNSDKKADLYKEIRIQIRTNQGLELPGMSNPAVLKPLFRKQTSKWQKLGQDHLESIVKMSENVAMKILAEVCKHLNAPAFTRNDLEDVISSFKVHAEKQAIERLRTFCQEITTFPLQTSNTLFLEKVTQAQHARFRGALERYRKTNPADNFLLKLMASPDPSILKTIPQVFGSWAIVDLNNINDLFDRMHPRGVQNTEDEIHDLLKAYYEVSCSRIRTISGLLTPHYIHLTNRD
jgi:uncharacterized protein (UPF0147 family)